ncbi:hypothetical protein C8F01DRAFT_1254727 [Mycena amicta]|nr:hypothetical protein C8F01DRAFT_1254727 [Mycena amicta]
MPHVDEAARSHDPTPPRTRVSALDSTHFLAPNPATPSLEEMRLGNCRRSKHVSNLAVGRILTSLRGPETTESLQRAPKNFSSSTSLQRRVDFAPGLARGETLCLNEKGATSEVRRVSLLPSASLPLSARKVREVDDGHFACVGDEELEYAPTFCSTSWPDIPRRRGASRASSIVYIVESMTLSNVAQVLAASIQTIAPCDTRAFAPSRRPRRSFDENELTVPSKTKTTAASISAVPRPGFRQPSLLMTAASVKHTPQSWAATTTASSSPSTLFSSSEPEIPLDILSSEVAFVTLCFWPRIIDNCEDVDSAVDYIGKWGEPESGRTSLPWATDARLASCMDSCYVEGRLYIGRLPESYRRVSFSGSNGAGGYRIKATPRTVISLVIGDPLTCACDTGHSIDLGGRRPPSLLPLSCSSHFCCGLNGSSTRKHAYKKQHKDAPTTHILSLISLSIMSNGQQQRSEQEKEMADYFDFFKRYNSGQYVPYHYGQQFAAATGGSQSSSSHGYGVPHVHGSHHEPAVAAGRSYVPPQAQAQPAGGNTHALVCPHCSTPTPAESFHWGRVSKALVCHACYRSELKGKLRSLKVAEQTTRRRKARGR